VLENATNCEVQGDTLAQKQSSVKAAVPALDVKHFMVWFSRAPSSLDILHRFGTILLRLSNRQDSENHKNG
jgi:hypothetical protein